MTDHERAATFKALGDDLGTEAKKLWIRYAELELKGLRKPALQALREFISEMKKSDEKANWTWRFCDSATRALGIRWGGTGTGFPVRQPLLNELILPALINGYRHGRSGAATFLGVLNVSGEALGLADIPNDPADLLREALKANDHDHFAREKLIDILYWRMDYTIHEAPHHGVLMAQIDEDIKIASELECLSRASGEEERYTGFIFLFRYYTTTWHDYKKRRADFTSFNDFLNRAVPFIPLTAAIRQTRE